MDHFFVRNKGIFTRIKTSDILYLEGCSNYVKVVTSQQSYLCLVRMKIVEQTLPADAFIRIHKSYIVPIDKVTGFTKDTVFIEDISLPVGNLYQAGFQEHFFVLEREARQPFETHYKAQTGDIRRRPLNWPLEVILQD